ncbi:hypothetical protein X975_03185, partial [Stegodyphus mimosarum]
MTSDIVPSSASPVCHHTRSRAANGHACSSTPAPHPTTIAPTCSTSFTPSMSTGILSCNPDPPVPAPASTSHLAAGSSSTTSPSCFPCKECGKSFSSRRPLRFHWNRQHRRSIPSSSPSADDFIAPLPSSPSPVVSSPHVVNSSSSATDPAPSFGPIHPPSTSRIDSTLHLVFPVHDVFMCTENSCSLLFRSGS